LLALRGLKALSDEAMVAELARATLLPGAPRGSIETLLHAFLPPAFVLHTHADATAALIDNPRSRFHVEKCFGGSVGLVPYQRPGFGLSVATAKLYDRGHSVGKPWRAILLDKHGLITWGRTGAEALAETTALLALAKRYVSRGKKLKAVKVSPAGRLPMPALRGLLSQGERQILHWDRSREAIAFSLRADAATLCAGGPATPDHLLFTKPRAMYVGGGSQGHLRTAVARFRRWYEGYFRRYAPAGSIRLDSAPRVVVIRGLGVVTTGKDPKVARIASDIFKHSMWVRTQAAGLGGYAPIGIKAVGDFEYWPLENYKLTLAPPEKELSRRIALVTGAGRGIGKACALRLAQAGACVAVLDKDARSARAVADAINAQQGSGRALALAADICDESAVRAAMDAVLTQWGGLDVLVNNAGIARTGAVMGLDLKVWRASLEVNATGHFIVAREAARVMQAQGLGGSMVFISSKNVPSPSAGFGAYSASKAAQTQLAKVLAQELAPLGVRVNCVTPDGVFEDSGLWKQIGPARAKAQGLNAAGLKAAYIQRNLLKREVRPQDVAEAVLYLASERSSRTTGTLLPVDGGLKDAFPR
jgi:rhamnose utilization protein RhaD (predicted bifunctional aldolase and dehydrogenase)/NAD(P)-dependent dehydrogenase (short-subunit alcohol dehydrogenase family)